MKVLLVDDEVNFLDVMVKRLKKRDVDATGLSDGNQVIEFIEKNDLFKVIIYDISCNDYTHTWMPFKL